MEDFDLTTLTDEQLYALIERVNAENRARQTMKEAEAEIKRIAQEAEIKRRSLAANFVIARDRAATPAADGTVPAWIAPSGAHNVYPQGYRVSHNGKVWMNTHHANSWEPGTTNSQWIEEVTEPEMGEPPVMTWGVGQAVTVGDVRLYNGQKWKAKIAHVTHDGWVPSEATYAVWEHLGAQETSLPEAPVVQEPTAPPAPTYPAWSKDATYKVGDKVRHNGKLWECLVAHGKEYQGTWAPGIAPTVWKDLGPVA